MKIEDARAKNDGELESELMVLKKEQLNLRFQRATGQLENTARVRTHSCIGSLGLCKCTRLTPKY